MGFTFNFGPAHTQPNHPIKTLPSPFSPHNNEKKSPPPQKITSSRNLIMAEIPNPIAITPSSLSKSESSSIAPYATSSPLRFPSSVSLWNPNTPLAFKLTPPPPKAIESHRDDLHPFESHHKPLEASNRSPPDP